MASPASRLPRTAIFFAAYGMLAAISLWFAYELRFVGADEPELIGEPQGDRGQHPVSREEDRGARESGGGGGHGVRR